MNLPEPSRRSRRHLLTAGLWLGVVLVVVTVPLVWNAPEIAHRAAGPRRIRAVLDQQVECWNRGDLEGFMRGYWESHELEFQSGDQVTRGWQAIFDRYRQRYQAEGREMGLLQFSEIDIQLESSEDAVVTGRWHLQKSDGSSRGSFSLRFRRFEADWKIVKDQTSSD